MSEPGVSVGEFRRGWRVLLASWLGIALGVSSLYFYSLGIFLKPMAAEFGWSRGQASLGALVGTLCAATMSIPVGRLVDRIGGVPVALGSLLLLALGFVALGTQTQGLGSFLVLTALLSLLTAGSSPLPFARLIVATFHRQRGLALGLTLSGTGIGAILIPALLPAFMAQHGWRAGFVLFGALIVACLPVLALLLRGAAGAATPTATLSSARAVIGNRSFIVLGLMFFCASVAVFSSVIHFVPMLTDAGLAPNRAGGIAALIGVAAIAGRLLTGWLLDRLAPELVTTSLFAVVAVGLLVHAVGGPTMAMIGALVVGLAVGAEVDLLGFLTGRYFRREDYGQAYGALYMLFLAGGAVGPALAGFAFDALGSYKAWLVIAAAMLGVASVLASRLSLSLADRKPRH